jgi:hypothetical protein
MREWPRQQLATATSRRFRSVAFSFKDFSIFIGSLDFSHSTSVTVVSPLVSSVV